MKEPSTEATEEEARLIADMVNPVFSGPIAAALDAFAEKRVAEAHNAAIEACKIELYNDWAATRETLDALDQLKVPRG